MKLNHLGLILLLVLVWGFNFIFIHLGLNSYPPLFLCVLRFVLTAYPFVFFIKRPKVPLKLLITYGVVLYGFQFAFLFSGMKAGMSPGLASLLAQTQAFFTIGLAAWLTKERPTAPKIIGACISFLGIVVVAFHIEKEITAIGLICTLLGAFSWASGNILAKKIGTVNPLALVVWGSLFAIPFLLATSLIFEGPTVIVRSVVHTSWTAALSVFYIVYMSTHLGYSIWAYLMTLYPAATIAPFSLLVPFFGFMGSTLVLGEPFPIWKFYAAALVILGLCVNVFSKSPASAGLKRPSSARRS
ncbi:EamA family transporter [bacterium]|nr:EamA family transporter [bacterium]